MLKTAPFPTHLTYLVSILCWVVLVQLVASCPLLKLSSWVWGFLFLFFYEKKKKTPVVFPMYEILSAVFCIFLFFFIFIFLTNCMESCQ